MMNPMVFTILAWEKELEMQCQAQRQPRCNPAMFMPEDRKPQQASRRPIFARLLGLYPQSPCGCS
jgi:hypothetical protein